MTISKWEVAALSLSGFFLAFTAGWFLRGSVTAEPIRVETQRTLTVTVTASPAALTAAPVPVNVTDAVPTSAEGTVPAEAGQTSAPESPAASEAASGQGKVNINTADAQTLMTLSGIGEKRAADIIADREANGPYRYPEDITRVKGIGEATLKKIIDHITVEDEE